MLLLAHGHQETDSVVHDVESGDNLDKVGDVFLSAYCHYEFGILEQLDTSSHEGLDLDELLEVLLLQFEDHLQVLPYLDLELVELCHCHTAFLEVQLDLAEDLGQAQI